jgi:RNA polymerase sigma-70 factor (ECF subfamily)
VAASDQDDFAACFQRYYPLIQRKCARMLRSNEEAEDVAQETFMRLWQHLPSGDIETATGWVYKTSTRLAIDRLRQKRRRPSEEAGAELRGTTDTEREVDQRLWLEQVARAIPSRELEVAILHRVDRLEQTEVAAVLGCSERTVRRLLTALDARLSALKERVS